MYKVLVILHLLGAATWIGGHFVLVGVVLSGARRERSTQRILDFERGFGKIGLGALALQLLTGALLTLHWVPDLQTIFSAPTPASGLIAVKAFLLVLTTALAGHTYHLVLPRLTPERMGSFAVHAWITTVFAVAMLVAGALIRLGGLQ
jgi:putative copper export protein